MFDTHEALHLRSDIQQKCLLRRHSVQVSTSKALSFTGAALSTTTERKHLLVENKNAAGNHPYQGTLPSTDGSVLPDIT